MKLILLILAAGMALAQTTRYPGAVDNDNSLFVVTDNVQTTLNTAMAIPDTTAVVASAAGFVPNMLATICDTSTSTGKCTAWEHMLVTAVAGNVLTVTRGFAGTAARAHSSGRLVSVLIDSAHQKVLKDSVVAIETALGPNLINLSSSPLVNSATYIFSPYSCNASAACSPGGPGGMNLIIGNNTLTMSPVPRGVNGSDAGHGLYVSGGTGAAEACRITGGSGTSGQPSGTIIVNCANAHTGAWTIQSATSGVQEAIQTVTTAGGTVQVPAGTYLIYGQIRIPTNVILQGAGKGITILRIANGAWNSGPGWLNTLTQTSMVSTVSSGVSYTQISDLTLDGNYQNQALNPGGNGAGAAALWFISATYSAISRISVINFRDSGALVYVSNQSSFTVVEDSDLHGAAASLTPAQVTAENCSGGIFVQGRQNIVRRNYMDGMCDDGYIANSNAGTEILFESNTFYGQVNHTGQAYHDELASGTRFINNYCNGGGVTAVCFWSTCPGCAANTILQGPTISNNFAENYILAGVQIGDPNATYTGSVITGNSINGTGTGTLGISLTGGAISATIAGNYIYGGGPSSGAVGIQVASNNGPNTNITISGNTIRRPSTAGIVINSPTGSIPGADPVTISANSIIDDRATPVMQYGIDFFASSANPRSLTVVGNTIKGAVTKDIFTNTPFTGTFNFEGNVTDGPMNQLKLTSGVNFAGLPASLGVGVLKGSQTYCTDCTVANPCAGGGTGAMAKNLNNVWVCN